MKLTQLRTLLAVHETGSLQGASRKLHSSLSALSRAVKELEDDLGVPLLERNIRGATVTAYGEHLLKYARHALSDLDRARQDITALKGQAGQHVTFGVTSSVTFMKPVQEALTEFVGRRPQVSLHVLELRPQQMLPMLREGTMDFALVSQPPHYTSMLEWVPVCRIPIQIVTRMDNPATQARSLRELRGEAWLSQDPVGDEQSALHCLFHGNGLEPPGHVIECPAIGLMTHLLYNARVLTLASTWSVDNPVDPQFRELMTAIDVVETIPDNYISLACLNQNLLTKSALELFTSMREKLKAALPAF